MRKRLYSQHVLVGCWRRPDGEPARDERGAIRYYPDPIHDAEAFCARYLEDVISDWGMYLRDEDYEDSIAELIRHLLRLEQRFDPERNDSFANYARSIIPRRVADVAPRRLLGRTGAKLHDFLHDQLDESAPGRRPDEAQPADASGPDPHWGSDDRGLQAERDRRRARAKAVLGLGTTRCAA